MRRWFTVFLVICGSVFHAAAQPSLGIDRVVTAWPLVEIEFSATCAGQPVTGLTSADVTLTEDGAPVTHFTLDCPPVPGLCRSSVTLLFDVSGSMMGSGIAGAMLAGHHYVDVMRPTIDEAAVMTFGSAVTLLQPMTKYRPLLDYAVDQLSAGGATSLYDGLYAAVEEAARGRGDVRAVIALSDGQDNSSTRTVDDIIALAALQRVRIFVVALGGSVNSTALERISNETQGKYYQTPNAGQLAAIYGTIAESVFRCFQRCTLRYESGCRDGSARTLRLGVPSLCGTGASATAGFTAPYDAADTTVLPLRLTSIRSMARREVTVLLRLEQQVEFENLHPSSLALRYDTASLEFKRVDVPAVSLIHGVAWTSSVTPGLIQLQTNTRALMHGSGTLFEFTFQTRDTDDTLCASVDIPSWSVSAGCLRPVVDAGEVCVYPWRDEPLVACDMAPAQQVEWRPARRGYVPDPVTVWARFENNGSTAAKNGIFVVEYDRAALRRVRPDHDTIVYSAADVIAGSHAAVAWDFEVLPRGNAAVLPVCIRARFDNHADVYCCTDLHVPASGPVLTCSLEIPSVAANPNRGEYLPMPIPATLTVTNTGKSPAEGVRTRIVLPPDLALADGESEIQILDPVILPPGGKASVAWMLLHAPTPVKRQYLVEAWAHCDAADSTRCERALQIPALDILPFRATLRAIGALAFCEGQSVTLDAGGGYDAYLWNTGDTTRLLRVLASGDYSCILRLGAREGTSDTVAVSVSPRPRPVLRTEGGNPLCPGDTLWIDAGSGHASYAWSNGLAVPRFPATRAGAYFVDVTSDAGCTGRSDTVHVTMFPAAAKPVISRAGDMLETDDAAAWQWMRHGMPIPGATARAYVLAEAGIYTVRVTDGHGCSAISDPYIVNILGVRTPAAAEFGLQVYPNPGSGMFHLVFDAAMGEEAAMTVTDMLGRVLQQRTITPGADNAHELDLRGKSAGVYILTVQTRQHTRRRTLLLD